MERSFASFAVLGLMALAWIGTHVLKSKFQRAGAWFVALSMALLINLFTPLRPGVERFGFSFFATLVGAIGSGVYFTVLANSGGGAGGFTRSSLEPQGEDTDGPADSTDGRICLTCRHSEPREGKRTVWCGLHESAAPSHYTCEHYERCSDAT